MSHRMIRLSLLVVALTATVAGCGAPADLAKATYTRTTVPAAEGIGATRATGSPRTNDAAFSADKLRRIDPCGLLDDDLLSRLGTPAEHDHADFSQCSNYMKDREGKELTITLSIGDGLVEDPAKADKNIGGLPAIEQELADSNACFATAVTETSPNRGIRVQTGGKAANVCQVARTVLESAVGRIRSRPPNYPARAGTLRESDACGLVGAADLTAVLDATAEPIATGLHSCTWPWDGAEVAVWLHAGFDPAGLADPAKTRKVDLGGISAIEQASRSGGDKCELSWAHLALPDNHAEVVGVTFQRYTAKPGEDTCAKVQSVAKALVSKLPKG